MGCQSVAELHAHIHSHVGQFSTASPPFSMFLAGDWEPENLEEP